MQYQEESSGSANEKKTERQQQKIDQDGELHSQISWSHQAQRRLPSPLCRNTAAPGQQQQKTVIFIPAVFTVSDFLSFHTMNHHLIQNIFILSTSTLYKKR